MLIQLGSGTRDRGCTGRTRTAEEPPRCCTCWAIPTRPGRGVHRRPRLPRNRGHHPCLSSPAHLLSESRSSDRREMHGGLSSPRLTCVVVRRDDVLTPSPSDSRDLLSVKQNKKEGKSFLCVTHDSWLLSVCFQSYPFSSSDPAFEIRRQFI